MTLLNSLDLSNSNTNPEMFSLAKNGKASVGPPMFTPHSMENLGRPQMLAPLVPPGPGQAGFLESLEHGHGLHQAVDGQGYELTCTTV